METRSLTLAAFDGLLGDVAAALPAGPDDRVGTCETILSEHLPVPRLPRTNRAKVLASALLPWLSRQSQCLDHGS